jgi:hypothetical membrane protein
MATATLSLKPASVLADSVARLSIVFAATRLALQALSLLVKPELDPSWNPISVYGLGNFGWLMTLAFLLWGLGSIGVAVALQSHVPTLAGRVGLGFLLIGGVGPILAGVFPSDPLTTAPDAMSTTGIVHSLGAVLGDGVPIGAAFVTWSLVRTNAAFSIFRRSLVTATVLAGSGLVLVSVSMLVLLPEGGGQLGADVPIGWQGRFMVVAYLA